MPKFESKTHATKDKDIRKRIWSIGIVENVNDDTKRRRIQVRFANEQDIEVAKLTWCQPFTLSSNDFQLPANGEPILVLHLDGYHLWLELPNKSAWQGFSDEDYPTAYKHSHKDVFYFQYTESEGFAILMQAVMHAQIKNMEFIVQESLMSMTFGDFGISSTDKEVLLGKQNAGNGSVKVEDNGDVKFNGGTTEYLADAHSTAMRLAALENLVNQLSQVFQAWTPVPMDGGAMLKSILAALPWHPQPIVPATKFDIGDIKLKH